MFKFSLLLTLLCTLLCLIALCVSRLFVSGYTITFVASYADSADIYLLDLDQGILWNLIASDTNENMAVWSPDGRRLAFVSYISGGADIFIRNREHAEPRNLTRSYGIDELHPTWSANSQEIAFHSSGDLYVINAESGDLRMLSSQGFIYLADWSPDGAGVIYTVMSEDIYEIVIVDVTTRERVILLQNQQVMQSPVWSPDGSQIALLMFDPQSLKLQLYLMNADGTSLQRLTDGRGDILSPRWSPDGRWIAYAEKLTRNYDIYVLEITTGTTRQLTTQPVDEIPTDWMP
jgi:TolB protein